MSLRRILKSEFTLKKFGFEDVPPGRFFTLQWRVSPLTSVVCRCLLVLYAGSSLLAAILVSPGHPVAWPAYLTNWSYSLMVLYHLTYACVVIHRLICRHPTSILRTLSPDEHRNLFLSPDDSSPTLEYQPGFHDQGNESTLPWYLKLVWLLSSTTSALALSVSVLYYSGNVGRELAYNTENLLLHCFNSVLVLADMLVSPVPVHLLHCVYPLCVGTIYTSFSAFYWVADHSHVMYPGFIDWKYPGRATLLSLGSLFMIVIAQCVIFITYKAKVAIYECLQRNRPAPLISS